MNSVQPIPLPAQYPALYTAARAALFRCDQVDECREWTNRAAALEAYARQSRDMDLLHMAERIKARAVRRCGELLHSIPTRQGRCTEETKPRTLGARAKAAGLSVHQRNTATRVASLPAEVFEERVEAATPATVTELANAGRRPDVRKHLRIYYTPKKRKGLLRAVAIAEECARIQAEKLAAALKRVDRAKEALAEYERAKAAQ